jgi:hypothetical protein
LAGTSKKWVLADEDDLVVIGNIEQFAQQRIRLSHHLVELLRAV